jgi:phosphatidylglycerol:prolipoprotein diacylglycerol transferase
MVAAITYDPIVTIDLGPLEVSPHGIGIAVGFLAGARLLLAATARRGISDEVVYSLLTRAALGAIIGARLAYVLNHLGDYSSPLDVLKVWEGGISLLGGIFGAILLALPKMRAEKLSFWSVMDAAAPGLALGILIGRIGDLIVADHLGKATDFFAGYRCPPLGVETASPCNGIGVGPNIPGLVVHQTALYDLVSVALLLVLLFRLRRSPRYDGFLIMVFGAWYGTTRIIEDFLREDLRRLGLTGSQWAALIVVSACLIGLVWVRRTPRWGRWDRAPGKGDEDAKGDEEDTGGADEQQRAYDPARTTREE